MCISTAPAEILLGFIQTNQGMVMTKTELIELSGIDTSTFHITMPQIFTNKCYDAGIDPLVLFAGWIHDEGNETFGRPLPLSELWEMAHANNMKPTLIFAKKMLKAGAKNCIICKGTGEIPTNTFDEPTETCNQCAPLYDALLDCEKGIGS